MFSIKICAFQIMLTQFATWMKLSMTHVGPVRFLDFGAMLQLAGEAADCEAKCINIDRDQDAEYK